MEKPKLIPLDLSVLSKEVIEILLLDSTAEPSIFEEIAQKNTHRPEVLQHLLNNPKTPETTRQFVAKKLQLPVPKITELETRIDTHEDETIREQKTQSLFQRIQKMKVTEKMQLSLRGSKDIRSILIRDPNKEVMLSVLENPKITESEIEIIAKQKSSPEEVIRAIVKKKDWLKHYSIVRALVINPKTPTAIALKHINSLRLKDLVPIEKDKNTSGVIREAAKKIVKTKRSA